MLSIHSLCSLITFFILDIQSTHAYQLAKSYTSANFLDSFDFFQGQDPTNGFVDFLSKTSVEDSHLVYTKNNQVYLGVDDKTNNPTGGRGSVRLTSTQSFGGGFFIADIEHMPGGICGTWPAYWLNGPAWPNNGEIDIIEGVNSASTNAVTLHTSPGCSVDTQPMSYSGSKRSYTKRNRGSGTQNLPSQSDCNSGDAHDGCGVTSSVSGVYGHDFNANGGGVFATKWSSAGIFVWFFPRAMVSTYFSNSSTSSPDTSNWGTPIATFTGSCDFDTHFNSLNIIFDTTFCGDWAGAVWGQDETCMSLASDCNSYVANNPSAFKDAYWLINWVKVYQ